MIYDLNKSGFFRGLAFSSQSELFENFSNRSDWLDKIRLSKIATFVLTVYTGYIGIYKFDTMIFV